MAANGVSCYPFCKLNPEHEGACQAEEVNTLVDRPAHYTWLPSGIEPIDLAEHLSFNVGSAIKYLVRAGRKEGADAKTDLEKAAWYVNREIKRLFGGKT